MKCTCEEFVRKVYGNTRGKCFERAVQALFNSFISQNSTLVANLARPLAADFSPQERKRTQELVSGWLATYDFVSPVNGWLAGESLGTVTDETTFALDFSDISKEFGGRGMEGMAPGWDASRHTTAMGHDFISVSIVGAGCPAALPVYVKLARGRRSKGELHSDALKAVMAETKGKGWFVEDRGMDSAAHIAQMKESGWKTVIRIKEMSRDTFGNGRSIDATLSEKPWHDTTLSTYRGAMRSKIRFALGCVQSGDGKDEAHNTKVLVVESHAKGKSIYLYVVCPDEFLDTTKKLLSLAVFAAQAYCNRWQIETSFLDIKQEFSLEQARVRTFKRLENLFSLCVLAYVFMTRHLRLSRHFKQILKALKDNLYTVSLRPRALLQSIRAIIGHENIRFITGRPRKVGHSPPNQMVFDF